MKYTILIIVRRYFHALHAFSRNHDRFFLKKYKMILGPGDEK